MGYIIIWALLHPQQMQYERTKMSFVQKIKASASLIPVVILIASVLGSIYAGIATATEAAGVGVVGALLIATLQGDMRWSVFKDSLMGATRMYCMIALILAGAQFLTLAMGYIGLPNALAQWIASLGLSQVGLILVLLVFFIIMGCFLDGISLVVLTMGVLLPTVQAAGIDLIWFGIFLIFVIEMAQITPPVGFNLFVLSGMSGKELTYVSKVAFPMFLLMIVAVFTIYYFPQIVMWLPNNVR